MGRRTTRQSTRSRTSVPSYMESDSDLDDGSDDYVPDHGDEDEVIVEELEVKTKGKRKDKVKEEEEEAEEKDDEAEGNGKDADNHRSHTHSHKHSHKDKHKHGHKDQRKKREHRHRHEVLATESKPQPERNPEPELEQERNHGTSQSQQIGAALAQFVHASALAAAAQQAGPSKPSKSRSKPKAKPSNDGLFKEPKDEYDDRFLNDLKMPSYLGDDEWDYEKLVERRIPREAEPPKGLTITLFPFQKESLYWMTNQENNTPWKGGILADEMGLGKTIQAISLIMNNRRALAGTSKSLMVPLPSRGETVKSTLVVCPLVALIQWRDEIAKHTEEGALSLYVYHGPKRTANPDDLAQYDIVLTTYSTVEIAYRQKLGRTKELCRYCDRKFYPDKLAVHNKFFCGPNAHKSAKLAKQERKYKTENEFNKTEKGKGKGKGKLKRKQKYEDQEEDDDEEEDDEDWVPEDEYGDDDEEDAGYRQGKGKSKHMPNMHVSVLPGGMTRLMFMQEAMKEKAKFKEHFKQLEEENKDNSVLHLIRWHRIILDEAHSIKGRTTSTTKGIVALDADFRWALSGTPLQNRVSELFSLIRFLRADPFAYYYSVKTRCKLLDWEMNPETRLCLHCQGSSTTHFSWFNKFILNPIKRYGFWGRGKDAMLRLKFEILDNLLLRRTKLGRAKDIALPSKILRLRRDTLDKYETDYYTALYTQSQAQFNRYVRAGTVLNNYAHIFDLLTRLRQALDHPYLIEFSEKSYLERLARENENREMEVANSGSAKGKRKRDDRVLALSMCGICANEADDCVAAECGDRFCRLCISEYVTSFDDEFGDTQKCPTCFKQLTVNLNAPGITEEDDEEEADNSKADNKYNPKTILGRMGNLSDFQSSTKVEALMEEVQSMLQRDPAAKAIVFSQYVSFLDIIEYRMKLANIRCSKLTGSMSIKKRDQYIQQFCHDPDTRLFLMSIKAGGIALNLTVASHIFIMDIWWNFAVELQAMDRVHRLQQYKPVIVTRFVIENSVEDRILRLQRKKQLVFDSTVGQNQESMSKLTAEDMRFLFA